MFEKKLYIAKRLKVESNENGIDIEYFDKYMLFLLAPVIGGLKPSSTITLKKDSKAKLYNFNYQPVSGYLGLQQYGEEIGNVYRMFIDKALYQGKIKVGDRAYLSNGEITESDLEQLIQNEKDFGDNANYKIELVLPQNFKMQIDLIKIK